MKSLSGDDAFFYMIEDNKLAGMILLHVDDFMIAGNNAFLKRCLKRWLRKGGVNTLFPAESLFQKVRLVRFWGIFFDGFSSQGN